ncbi:Gamma-secretase subunit pen-2 [Thelohanellus kitauei]|uniref:Gamma-secretase subunit pen-2 n=1 Tax=Thelohanellus kitauei TaxID=669202 RepID=A0A0C2N340_THEKT|nr:Gamma-secretase subunit pen-2 [Thelohanellus kitauei]
METIDENHDELEFKKCRKYFITGLFFLPAILFANSYNYSQKLYRIQDYEHKHRIRKYIGLSIVFGVLYCLAFIIWNIVFMSVRTSWGYTGDLLNIHIPLGRL